MAAYEVKNEKNRRVGKDLLFLFYGNLWKSALDRIYHKPDGHIMSIYHRGHKFRIYRKLKNKIEL